MTRQTSQVAAVFVVILACVGAIWVRHAAQYPQGQFDYVALGSSFAAGPGIAHRARKSYLPCWRSDSDYAHLFAQRAGLRLNDVSCSGATTKDLLHGGQLFQPAQVTAVGPETKLVTITAGGNDVFYLGNLAAFSCRNRTQAVPIYLRLFWKCQVAPPANVEEAFQKLPLQLIRTVAEVRTRAPGARIVLIDYISVLPQSAGCDELPLSPNEADELRRVANRLAEVTAEVASLTHTELLKASELTDNHTLCSGDPWVNGFEFPRDLHSFGPAPFHPKYQAMNAVAEQLLHLWGDTPRLK